MALINITNIQIDNNPAPFQTPFRLHVTFECLEDILNEDIDWEFRYIGSTKDDSKDVILDSFSMGPLEKGVMQFTLESEAPDYKKFSKDDLLSITAIILSASYKKKEFFRVGYYTNNCYTDPELIQNDPPQVLIDQVQRSILQDKPRITRFDIQWKDQVLQEITNSENNQQMSNLQFQGNNNNNQQNISYNDAMFGDNSDFQQIIKQGNYNTNEVQNNQFNGQSINFNQNNNFSNNAIQQQQIQYQNPDIIANNQNNNNNNNILQNQQQQQQQQAFQQNTIF